MKGPLLFIAADPRECTPLVALWQGVRVPPAPVAWARTGMWKGREVIAIANGAGARRAFEAVAATRSATAVCNIGFCGALDQTLNIGDIVVATEIRNGTKTWPSRRPQGPAARMGVVASIDRIAATALEKKDLRATGASVVEMEAKGAACAACELGAAFYCVRAVSDLATEDFANDFNAALTAEGRFSVPRLLAGALSSPRKRLAELIRLKDRTAMASRKLGDFLADCEF